MFLDGFCMKRPKTWRDLILSDTLVRRKCMRKPHSVPLGNWGGHRLGTNSFAPMHNPFETENCWTEAKSQSCYVVVKDMYIISDINLIYKCIYIYIYYVLYIYTHATATAAPNVKASLRGTVPKPLEALWQWEDNARNKHVGQAW